ncbi:MAG: ATP-dependent helicase RecG [Candidatus Atribacteria bacterium]|nr:ATP-dependent helicase RecG [Candidatus Atribacteria bacterium]
MGYDKQFVLKIIDREKKRLDNLTVFGGFDRFMREWLLNQNRDGESEKLASSLGYYQDLGKKEKVELLEKIEKLIQADNSLFTPPAKPAQKESPPKVRLDTPVRFVKGVGPVLEKKLNRLNLRTVEDLIFFFPRTYQDRGPVKPISQLRGKEIETIKGVVSFQKRIPTRRGNLLKIGVKDATGLVYLVCFNRPYLAKALPPGLKVTVTGSFRFRRGQWETGNFEFFPMAGEGDSHDSQVERIVPIYSLTQGVTQKKLRSLISEALEEGIPQIKEVLPPDIRDKYQLLNKKEAIWELHYPSFSPVTQLLSRRSRAHWTLIFEEFLLFALSLKMRKRKFKDFQVKPCVTHSNLVDKLLAGLPFQLTSAQERVYQEISRDLESGLVMNRLVQGDVGSGKTLVALMSSLKVIDSGHQVAFMVPTEILAEQHYQRFKDQLTALGVRVGLLVGGKNKQKADLLVQIERGEIDLVIGTHALLEEKVVFPRLGLVVVDEQHRFGVIQRAKLKDKALVPHTLVMTATPIPRTLALTLYGDLDVSIVDEKPAGRKPVTTLCFSQSERFKAYNRVRKRIEEGQQAFVVCPAIEENEEELSNVTEIFQLLKEKWLSDFQVEIIHGKLPPREKEDIMSRFARREIEVLVATSVIEVGIDVPNANVMVIENAERFGLAQLHQLRGRIGRGDKEGSCLLLANAKTEEAKKRMEIMLKSNDGFEIAEADLRLRGPGEFYGVRQHGIPEFHLADPFEDWPILEKAHQEAELLLGQDPFLHKKEYQVLKQEIERRFGKYLELGEVS